MSTCSFNRHLGFRQDRRIKAAYPDEINIYVEDLTTRWNEDLMDWIREVAPQLDTHGKHTVYSIAIPGERQAVAAYTMNHRLDVDWWTLPMCPRSPDRNFGILRRWVIPHPLPSHLMARLRHETRPELWERELAG